MKEINLHFGKIILTSIGIAIGNYTFSQLTIDNTSTSISGLVNGVLIPSGSGTVVSNVQFRGCLNVSGRYQAGTFTAAGTTQTDLGFANGVVLSTGNTSDIPLTPGVNPGSVAQISRNYVSGTPGEIRSSNPPAGRDADAANLIAPQNYYNAAILEFDFIPVSSDVSFQYVFASEEYNDQSGSAFAINYNCSSYNDRFAFLISGPGIAGGQGYLFDALNIARLSNGSQVGINSVNDGVVGSSGGAPNAANCLAANGSWTNGSPTTQFKGCVDGSDFNGNTKVLTASYSGMTPGLTYHIRLVIADSNDGAYDSAVFLQGGSFTTDPITLPVEFVDLVGTCKPEGNQLSWTTASERNSDYFVIEAGKSMESLASLDTIKAMENTQWSTEYRYTHVPTSAPVTYYRLSQADLNGVKSILKTIAIENACQREDQMNVYYNAFNSSIVVNAGNQEVQAVLLYNSMGQEVKRFPVEVKGGDVVLKLNEELPKGIYLVEVVGSTSKITERILLH